MSKLPDGFQVRSRKEWEEILQGDATKRGLANASLRSLGYAPATYFKWTDQEKLDTLLKHQSEAGEGEKSSAAASSKPKAGAAPAAASSSGGDKAPAAASSSGGGGGGSAALEKKIAGLEAQLVEQGKLIAEQGVLLKEVHLILRVQMLSNAELESNVKELAGDLGTPVLEGNG